MAGTRVGDAASLVPCSDVPLSCFPAPFTTCTSADPVSTISDATITRGPNGSFAMSAPSTIAMTGLAYAYSDTVAVGRCLSA